MSTVMVCFHPTEFAAVLKISGFNLPANVIIKLVKEADVNGDALIQYRGSLIQKASKSKRAHARKQGCRKEEDSHAKPLVSTEMASSGWLLQ